MADFRPQTAGESDDAYLQFLSTLPDSEKSKAWEYWNPIYEEVSSATDPVVVAKKYGGPVGDWDKSVDWKNTAVTTFGLFATSVKQASKAGACPPPAPRYMEPTKSPQMLVDPYMDARKRNFRGLSSTVATTPLGLSGAANVAKPTLLSSAAGAAVRPSGASASSVATAGKILFGQ